MGARTVAGATRTLPIRTSGGTQTSSGMACESGLSQDLRIGNGLILPGKSEHGGRKGNTEGHGTVLCDLRSWLRDLAFALFRVISCPFWPLLRPLRTSYGSVRRVRQCLRASVCR